MNLLRIFNAQLLPWLLLLAVFLLSIISYLIFAHQTIGFGLDDAWIHLVYSRCLWQHGMFCYNAGIPATGDSSPLWVIFVALIYGVLHHFGTSSIIVGVFILNAIFYLTMVIVAWHLVYLLTQKKFVSNIVAICLIFNVTLLCMIFMGMEVYLSATLIILSLLFYLKRNLFLTGCVLALACCTRPETAIIGGILVFYEIFFSFHQQLKMQDVLKNFCQLIIPSTCLAAIWFSYNYFNTQHFLPAPFYFKKTMSLGGFFYSVKDFFKFDLLFFPPFIVPTLLFFLGFFYKNPESNFSKLFWLLPLFAGGIYILFNLYLVGFQGFSFYCFRYYIPAIPLIIVAIILGCYYFAEHFHSTIPWALLLFALVINNFLITDNVIYFTRESVKLINRVDVGAGKWFAEYAPPSSTIAISDAGAIRYFAPQYIIDVVGLNTPEFIWNNKIYIKAHPANYIYIWIPNWYFPTIATQKILFAEPNTNFLYMKYQHIYNCQTSYSPVPANFIAYKRVAFLRDLHLLCQKSA